MHLCRSADTYLEEQCGATSFSQGSAGNLTGTVASSMLLWRNNGYLVKNKGNDVNDNGMFV